MSLYSGGYTGDSLGNPEIPASIMDLENVFRVILNVVTRLAGIAVSSCLSPVLSCILLLAEKKKN